jgi:hypothetical protein
MARGVLQQRLVADLMNLNALLERTVIELDRKTDDLRHENTDVTDVMNWIAGVRQRARIAQNADTLELNAV